MSLRPAPASHRSTLRAGPPASVGVVVRAPVSPAAGARRGRVGAGCLWMLLFLLAGVAGAGVMVLRRVNYMESKHDFAVSTWVEANSMYARRLALLEELATSPEGKKLVGQPAMRAVNRAREELQRVSLPGDVLPVTQEDLDAYLAAQSVMNEWQDRFLLALEEAGGDAPSPTLREQLARFDLAQNRLALAHRDFFDAVWAYNASIREVPDVFLAKMAELERCPAPEIRLPFSDEIPEEVSNPFGGP